MQVQAPAKKVIPNPTRSLTAVLTGHSERLRGLSSEDRVFEMCRKKFPKATISEERDADLQRFSDIDGYINGNAISIKDQTRGWSKSGRLSFELSVFYRPMGRWQLGNFSLCKAKFYLVLLGDSVYRVSVSRMKELADSDHNYAVMQNNAATVARQMEMNHPHSDAKNLLVPLKDLLEQGIALKII